MVLKYVKYFTVGAIVDSRAFTRSYLADIKQICDSISVSDIESVIEILFKAWQDNKQVFICGNGGSASTASHMTCDLLKSVIVEGKKRFIAHCLNDNVPLVSALTNDEGFDNLYSEQLINLFKEGDVLVCISVHGGAGRDKAQLWSQNLLKAMKYAGTRNGKTIGFSGFDGGPMKEIADACIVVPMNSTPHVESFHGVLEHLICTCLKQRIMET
jgi:D-sedoheptulose 7-phosphate isomerase